MDATIQLDDVSDLDIDSSQLGNIVQVVSAYDSVCKAMGWTDIEVPTPSGSTSWHNIVVGAWTLRAHVVAGNRDSLVDVLKRWKALLSVGSEKGVLHSAYVHFREVVVHTSTEEVLTHTADMVRCPRPRSTSCASSI